MRLLRLYRDTTSRNILATLNCTKSIVHPVIRDRVLLANRVEPGKCRVADRWESTAFVVMSVKPELNVYRVKDTLTGRERVARRNLLLFISFLPGE